MYLPGPGEQPAGALKLPWDAERDYAAGEFARAFGSKVPTRLVASAKSWLCHPGVDRKAAILPFRAGEGDRRVSPLDACTRYLRHLAEAWNFAMAQAVPEHRLEAQDVVLTVPASFDAAARDLTIEAAKAAGLEHVTMLEEPQAAFYAWLDNLGDKWRESVNVGDLVLVADVGGGTTDFTLIEVGEENGNLALTRLAVGDHLLLGGDNMDLAVAHTAAAALAKEGAKLDANQMTQLTYAARAAKEQLLGDTTLASAAVTVLGKGRSVVGGTVKYDLPRADVERVLVDGFFPECDRTAEPARGRSVGLQELGLPYVADAGVTRHLAHFLARQAEALASRDKPAGKKRKGGAEAVALPTAVLFNGGVFKAPALQARFLGVLNAWAKSAKAEGVRSLAGTDLDQAVARGAAYYGLVRRGKGVRIRGGTARAYYIGVETAAPAVPGMSPPLQSVVRRAVRHGGGDGDGGAGPGVRPDRRRGGRVPLPRLDGAAGRPARHRRGRLGGPNRRADADARHARRARQRRPRGARAPEREGDGGGPVGGLVPEPRRRPPLEAGVQRPRSPVTRGPRPGGFWAAPFRTGSVSDRVRRRRLGWQGLTRSLTLPVPSALPPTPGTARQNKTPAGAGSSRKISHTAVNVVAGQV